MTKTVDIELLRAQIWSMEQGSRASLRTVSLGVAALDGALPGQGLPLGQLHQIGGDAGAVEAFCTHLAARISPSRPVLWVVRDTGAAETLYAPGLARYGLTPDRLIVVRAESEADLLWTMEEGLRCPGLAAVVGQTDGLSLTAERRLQLAAEMGCVTGFLIRDTLKPAPRQDTVGLTPSVASTRWTVRAAPSHPDTPDVPHWHVTLERCRGGAPAAWFLEWDDATGNLSVATDLHG